MRIAGIWVGLRIAATAALLSAGAAQARDFSFDLFGTDVETILNNSLTAGAQWRLHDRADYLVGKSNLDPDVCAGVFQLCQGVARGQGYPAARLRDAPGQASMNFDDGNLNYDKGDVVQAPFVMNTDVKFRFSNMELFVRGRGVYDPLNYDFDEFHPNKVTPENFESVLIRGDPFANRYFGATLLKGAVVRDRGDSVYAAMESPEQLLVIAGGGPAGGFGAIIPPWLGHKSRAVTLAIGACLDCGPPPSA